MDGSSSVTPGTAAAWTCLRAGAATLAVLASVAPVARAQSLGSVSPTEGAARAEEDPRGVRIAVSLGMRADGNVGLSADDPQSATFATAEGAAGAVFGDGILTLALAAAARAEEPIAGAEAGTRTASRLGATLDYAPSQRFSARLSASASEAILDGFDAPFQAAVGNRRQSERCTVGASATYQDGLDTRWSASLRRGEEDFSRPGDGLVPLTGRDTTAAEIEAGRETGFGLVALGYEQEAVSGPGEDATLRKGGVSVTLGRGDASTLTVRVGYAAAEIAGGPDKSALTWQARADWRPTDVASVTLDAGRDLRPAFLAGEPVTRRTSARLSAAYEPTALATLTAYVAAREDAYGAGRSEDAAFAGIGLDYDLGRGLATRLSADASRRSFAGQGGELTVRDETLTFGLSYKWGRGR